MIGFCAFGYRLLGAAYMTQSLYMAGAYIVFECTLYKRTVIDTICIVTLLEKGTACTLRVRNLRTERSCGKTILCRIKTNRITPGLNLQN